MKKPTKAQRHRIYKDTLKRMEQTADDGYTPFICCSLDLACFAEFNEFPDRKGMSYFPEFAAAKPAKADYVWWPSNKRGNAARFAAIHKMIASTAPTPRKKP